jgi:2-aminoadipate transaminase
MDRELMTERLEPAVPPAGLAGFRLHLDGFPSAAHPPAHPPTHPTTETDTPWSDRFALRARGVTSSIIREMLKYTEDPEVISFAGGLPAPEVFPTDQIEIAARKVLVEHGAAALQYGTTEGYLPLRELLVRHMARYGIEATPANVLVTTGAQQALDLVGKLFVNSGDRLLTEEPTYLGALQAFTAYQAQYLTVPIDDDGMRMDRLEEALRAGPKFLYVLPNFQNPGGVTLSLERRWRLVELASHYGAPIVEDDPYGQLRYEGEHLPPLVEIDAQHHGATRGGRSFRGGVLYLGTLSKTLAPGLRVGWIVAPEAVMAKLVQMKQGMDLHTSTFAQMLAALSRHFPPGVRWTRPQGGLFLWATLPEGYDTSKLLTAALRQKVAFVPGRAFYPNGGGERSMRLNFSYCTPEVIEEGIRRLGAVVAGHLHA